MNRSLRPLAALLLALAAFATPAAAQEAMIGEIRMFAGNFAPRGWAFCDGQLVAISQNTALFSIIGTIYGGDGRTTFALPDLRGRAPVHSGIPPGGTEVRQGQRGGNLPVTPAAAGQGVAMPPTLGIRYIIATQGIFPSRS